VRRRGADEVPDIAERYLTYGGWTREHGDYGWASGLGGRKKPSFATLEGAVDLSHLRPEFRAASHEIHADSEGLRSNLSARGDANYPLSGPTNAGLSRPGLLALIYLYQVTTTMSAAYPDVDDQVFVRAIGLLLDEACVTFDAAERALERAEEELQERLRQKGSPQHCADTASRC
jgi:hypothetical protein